VVARLGGRDEQLATEVPLTSYCIAEAGRLYFLGTSAYGRLYVTCLLKRSFPHTAALPLLCAKRR
jgi:hypothetical protein